MAAVETTILDTTLDVTSTHKGVQGHTQKRNLNLHKKNKDLKICCQRTMRPSPSAKTNQLTLPRRLQDSIIEKLNGSRVTIVVGPTGSGKVCEEIRR
jgi:HrpA-like RNA helicase